ncbi:MAG: DUF2442 domain-containing protein [Blastocatellia bacterium]
MSWTSTSTPPAPHPIGLVKLGLFSSVFKEGFGMTSQIVNVTVTDDTLSVDLEDGRTIAVPIGWYPRLAYGTPAERANVQISGAGYGMHWPDLDEDLGIEGLLLGRQSTESASSLKRWLQRREETQARETA